MSCDAAALWKWLKSLTSLYTLICYLLVGAISYHHLEGWSYADSTYFLVVTMTTVGFGDFCPESPEGRLFTCVYALLGITVVFHTLSPVVDFFLKRIDMVEKWAFTRLEQMGMVQRGADVTSVEELAAASSRINYCRQYMLALMGPLIVLIFGVISTAALEQLSWIDALYLTIITMTTIGYGDLTPSTTLTKIGTALFLPVAVVSLANGITRLTMTHLRRKIREIDQGKIADQLLLKEARGNPDETLTEAEFLVSVLKENEIGTSSDANALKRLVAHGMMPPPSHALSRPSNCSPRISVDDITIAIIRAEFRELVAVGRGAFETRVLDSHVVFLQLKADQRIAQRADQPPGTCIGNVALVDTNARDGGYSEWRKHHWEKQVAKQAHNHEAHKSKAQKEGKSLL